MEEWVFFWDHKGEMVFIRFALFLFMSASVAETKSESDASLPVMVGEMSRALESVNSMRKLDCALGGVPENTEVKIGIACADLPRLGLLRNPKGDHIIFYERPGRPFQKAGVILRKRTGDHNDVTVKVRPKSGASNLDVANFPSVEQEGDWTLAKRVNSYSYKMDGNQFTTDQMKFLRKITAEPLQSIQQIEVESHRWTLDQSLTPVPGLPLDTKVSVEQWMSVASPSKCLSLEISARVKTGNATLALQALKAYVSSRSVPIDPLLQENKTSRLFDLYLGK